MFLLVNKFKMIEMRLKVVHCRVQKSYQKRITKESNGFHNHSTNITIKQQYRLYITPLTVHNVLFQSYLIFFVTVYKTTKQTKDCAPSGKSRKKNNNTKTSTTALLFLSLMFAAFHKQSPRITMLFILLNETKSLLNAKKILLAASLDHV